MNSPWARACGTGLSSLWDRAAARLAALRFNPSRWLGKAMIAAPFVVLFVLGWMNIGFGQIALAFVGVAAFAAWVAIATMLAFR